MDKEQLSFLIGKRLKNMRQQRGWSLDTLAQHCQVSKPMLGQIERGESNPTVSTLWKIANGLNVSFTAFLEEQQPSVKIVRAAEVEPITEQDGRFNVYPIFPKEDRKPFELFTVRLEAGATYCAEAHRTGVEEYIVVQKGSLSLEVRAERHQLKAGDGIHFVADEEHYYRNESAEEDCLLTLVIFYPGE
ncbi:XRE family transcriptional regulator [Alkalihalobacillus oceani]|uniref:helix-turn-helix domain-containing protein n=1 Tax=Halalkalibacter oceani TaxID=1653776 RepID=UPI00203C1E5C|nr:XRE family transcriptional regulator [Halalkalibacter oceani]MCM3759847.1 XRE family transcriptional regulator [Halalkalibacter oceani]